MIKLKFKFTSNVSNNSFTIAEIQKMLSHFEESIDIE